MSKRTFYNTGDRKGFTRAKFFDTLKGFLGEIDPQEFGFDEDLFDNCMAALDYEIEGLQLKADAAKAKSGGEKKDPLESPYAKAVQQAILSVLSSNPQTAGEMEKALADKGVVSPTGKGYKAVWIAKIANLMPGIEKTTKVVKIVKKAADGTALTSEKQATAYKKA